MLGWIHQSRRHPAEGWRGGGWPTASDAKAKSEERHGRG